MATDIELFRDKNVKGLSYSEIAAKYDLEENSIRGRVSRLPINQRIEIMQEFATLTPLENANVGKQRKLIAAAEAAFQQRQFENQSAGQHITTMFISDLHLPYTNFPAVRLALEILADIKPAYVSTFNDLFDFTGYGRWPDVRDPASRIWEDNIQNAISTAAQYHDTIRRFSPATMLLQVMGNHDKWMYHCLRSTRNGYTEQNIYEFMAAMADQGVQQFSNGMTAEENVIEVSPGLKWVHGVSTATLANTVGKNTIERLGFGGVFYNTVAGHVHRAFEVKHLGVTHWNSGTMSRHDMGYLKHPPQWDTAIVINTVDPNSREVWGEIVYFRPRGSRLEARYNGRGYSVENK